ncbi:hydrolase [Clostridia bacterium]|nr:hydrolase [Clostridia bacterium]
MIYFTADLHFGHTNIIRFCNRPFQSVAEMNSVLIDNWNAVVCNNDDIYILGDLFYRNDESAEKTLKRLNGIKHLVLGNHDKRWVNTVELSKYFALVTNLLTYKLDGVKYTLCHYPMLSWEGCGHGGYMIHGHTHNHHLGYTDQYLLNAGVDINGYIPVTLNELIRNNERFNSECKDELE